jgi:hypothetical protein
VSVPDFYNIHFTTNTGNAGLAAKASLIDLWDV